MELPVVLWMFIVSQIFGFIAVGLVIYRYQFKNKQKTLKIAAVGHTVKIFNYVFIMNWSLAGLKMVSVVKTLMFAKTSKGSMKLWKSLSILIGFSMVSVVVVFFVWWSNRIWFEWVVLSGTLLTNFGKWAKGIHIMRITSIISKIIMLVNSLFFFLNFADTVTAVFVLGSIAVFYIRWFKEKNVKKKDASEDEEIEKEVVEVADTQVATI